MNPAMHGLHVLPALFCARYPEGAARVLDPLPAVEAAGLLFGLQPSVAGGVLAHMTTSQAGDALATMAPESVAALLRHVPEQTAATVIAYLPPEARQATLAALPTRLSAELATFLSYPPNAVGSLMDPQVMALPGDVTVEFALAQVRAWKRTDLHDLYVVDRTRVLLGRVTLQSVLLSAPDESLASIMESEPLAVHPLDEREYIVDVCNRRYLFTVPVVDLDRRLLGVVRTQAIFRAGQEDAGADMVTMVGASRDERALSPVLFSVGKRLPWLQINLLTAFLAAFVVGMFEDTIARFTALAVLLPVVAGQSGNTGSQSLAVVMRGLALRDIVPAQLARVAAKEVSVAFINAVAVVLTTGIAVYLWSESAGLVLVIAVSMILSMCMAGFAGAVIPIVLRLLKQDPAQSSSIILTTVTDVVGFSSFLGLATLFASMLTQ